MGDCFPKRILIGDRSTYYAFADLEDPDKSAYDVLLSYLSYSESKIILPIKDFDEIIKTFKEDKEKEAYFIIFLKEGI